MKDDIDPVKARQARQGKPVLLILAISLVLAALAAWFLWGAVADNAATAFLDTTRVATPVQAEPSVN